jgi:acyl-CoA thioesterase-1
MKIAQISILLAATLTATALRAADSNLKSGQQKLKDWRDAVLAQVPDEPGLPRVLLIGDSISMGYTLQVRKALDGKANVHRPPENCFYAANGLKKLDTWLGDKKWDVIHFNFGLHDNNYLDADGKLVDPANGNLVATPAEYEKNLHEIVRRLKETGATLIFATTTPIPVGSPGRVAGAEVAYNEAALRVMKDEGVMVNDLHAFVLPRQEKIQRPNNVHYTDEGYDEMAKLVVAKIETALRLSAKQRK